MDFVCKHVHHVGALRYVNVSRSGADKNIDMNLAGYVQCIVLCEFIILLFAFIS